MGSFRRVEGEKAGPTALGILVPPARRTVLILRPRTLAWDLVLAQAGGGFSEMTREDAERVAHDLAATLETNGNQGHVEPVYSLDALRTWLRVRIGGFSLTVCPRLPGQAYQAQLFPDVESLRTAIAALTTLLCPPPGTEQELYLNTRNFTRPS